MCCGMDSSCSPHDINIQSQMVMKENEPIHPWLPSVICGSSVLLHLLDFVEVLPWWQNLACVGEGQVVNPEEHPARVDKVDTTDLACVGAVVARSSGPSSTFCRFLWLVRDRSASLA